MINFDSASQVTQFWCYICEATINVTNLTNFSYHCLICGSDSIEMITNSNNPSDFQPPIRPIECKLIRYSINKYAKSSTKPTHSKFDSF